MDKIFLSIFFIFTLISCKSYNGEVNVYNWGEYIANGSDNSVNLNKKFTEETGIKVNYMTFATNEELYAKMKSSAHGFDIIIPSDYMISRMIEENMLEKIDFENIPNYALIGEKFKNREFDYNNEYSVPYMWSTVGIIYNTKKFDGIIDSWNVLWDEKYSGNILMFNNSRDAFGIALKKLGFSMNTTNIKEINLAAEELKKQRPLVQAYVMDEIFDKMENGEATIAPYYSGDAITMMSNNPDLAFAFPREGTNIFIDSMCIPKDAKNKKNAEIYINFMCRTDNAKENSKFIGYSTPQNEAYESLDEELKNSEIAYPPKNVLDKTENFLNLPNKINQYIDELWIDIKL